VLGVGGCETESRPYPFSIVVQLASLDEQWAHIVRVHLSGGSHPGVKATERIVSGPLPKSKDLFPMLGECGSRY